MFDFGRHLEPDFKIFTGKLLNDDAMHVFFGAM